MEEAKRQSSQTKQNEYIDITALVKTIWQRRKLFYWVLPITFVLSSALILCVPRYYRCEVILAPEAQSSGPSGSLQALASSFGFNMQNMTSSDALYPSIYPDIVQAPDFLVKLFDVPVATVDGDFEGTFYQYMLNKHRRAFWKRWKSKIKKLITPEEPEISLGRKTKNGVDVFCMNKWQWYVVSLLQDNIKCSVDKKTDVITFRVTAQDQLVCATIADSVCTALQSFITEYRTKKARVDIAYYEEVMNNAQKEYNEACEQYIRYADSHSGINLEQYRLEAKNLETEMQIKQAAYTSFQKQYLATQARLQENTPVYTVLQSASIPLKPAGPKRMIFVIAMLFLATCATCVHICKDQLIAILTMS